MLEKFGLYNWLYSLVAGMVGAFPKVELPPDAMTVFDSLTDYCAVIPLYPLRYLSGLLRHHSDGLGGLCHHLGSIAAPLAHSARLPFMGRHAVCIGCHAPRPLSP